jgi:hypothetical protein
MEGLFNPESFESGGGKIGRANKPTKEGLSELLKFIGVEAKEDQITKRGIEDLFINQENKNKLAKFLKEDPIVVKSYPDKYLEIKDGNHRYELAKLAKIKDVPVTDKIKFPTQTPKPAALVAESFTLPPPPEYLERGRMATEAATKSTLAKDVGRNLLPAAKQLGTALGTEAVSVGGMALRGAGRLAGPVGLAMTAYDLAQAFPAPAPISEEDMGQALRSYRTGPQPAY